MAGGVIDEIEGIDDLSRDRWSELVRGLTQSRPDRVRELALPLGIVIARWVAVGLAGLCLWLITFGFVLSGIEEHRAQHTLYAKFREQLALATAPTGGLIANGTPVALISASRAGLSDVVIVEGTGGKQLQEGPGHKRDTPLPGQPGISQVFGRSTTFGGPFGSISSFRAGDEITVTTAQAQFVYKVDAVRHKGDPVAALESGHSRLTLVTSQGGGWRSGWAPSDAIYVDASLQGDPKFPPAGRPNYVSAHENAMHSDTSALLPLLFWTQLLVLVVVGSIWASRRWASVPVWMVGGVTFVALLWQITDVGLRLVPNLV